MSQLRLRWLVVAEEEFVPANAGGRVETLNLLRAASSAGIGLAVVVPGAVTAASVDAHRAALPAAVIDGAPRREGLRANLTRDPYVFASRPVPEGFVTRWRERHQAEPFDAVVAVSFRSVPLATTLARALGLPMLVRPYNIESDYFEALAATSRPPRSVAYRWEARKLRWAEKRIHRDPTVTAFAEISEQDAVARRAATASPVLFVPPFVGEIRSVVSPVESGAGVDRADGELTVLFLGSLDFANNIEGIRWFAGGSWPLVRARAAAAGVRVRFRVAGRRASPTLVDELRSAGAEVLVDVPDVAPVLAAADVFVNPVRAGAGVNIKMVEAMAAGLPVVSTSVGARGLSWRDGEHLLIADDVQSLAEAVADLLVDGDRRDRIRRQGNDFVRTTLDGRRQIDRLVAALEGLPVG